MTRKRDNRPFTRTFGEREEDAQENRRKRAEHLRDLSRREYDKETTKAVIAVNEVAREVQEEEGKTAAERARERYGIGEPSRPLYSPEQQRRMRGGDGPPPTLPPMSPGFRGERGGLRGAPGCDERGV
jgi:hypothetical protein